MRKAYQVNNLVFLGETYGRLSEFLIRMVGALGIITDRRPKGKPRKREN